jgi:hypothetical protein
VAVIKPVTWMVAAGVAAWLLVTMVWGERANPEAFWGMVGPLASATASWVAYARVHRQSPVRLTNVMIAGMGVKLVFFSAYVAIMVRVLALRPEPFIASLVSAFVAFHAIEAASLRKMIAASERALSGEGSL